MLGVSNVGLKAVIAAWPKSLLKKGSSCSSVKDRNSEGSEVSRKPICALVSLLPCFKTFHSQISLFPTICSSNDQV